MKDTRKIGKELLLAGTVVCSIGLVGFFNNAASHPHATECEQKMAQYVECSEMEKRDMFDASASQFIETGAAAFGGGMAVSGFVLLGAGIYAARKKNTP